LANQVLMRGSIRGSSASVLMWVLLEASCRHRTPDQQSVHQRDRA
jgi:hypothetical protein